MALKQIIAGTALACLALTVVGCGSSSSSSSSTTTTAKQKVCADKDKLQSSVNDLADPSVLTGGKSSITSALDKVKKNLTALRTSAKAEPAAEGGRGAVGARSAEERGRRTSTASNLSESLSKAGDASSKVGVVREGPGDVAQRRVPVELTLSSRLSERRGLRAIRLTTSATTVTRYS